MLFYILKIIILSDFNKCNIGDGY